MCRGVSQKGWKSYNRVRHGTQQFSPPTRARTGRRRTHQEQRAQARPRRERLYGAHAVAAALANPSRRCHRLIATEEGAAQLAERADARALPLAARALLDAPQIVSRQDLAALLPEGAVHQGIVLETAPLPAVDLASACRGVAQGAEGARTVVVLDQVTDPHNVGAILRSAAAFAVGAVVVQDRHSPQGARARWPRPPPARWRRCRSPGSSTSRAPLSS